MELRFEPNEMFEQHPISDLGRLVFCELQTIIGTRTRTVRADGSADHPGKFTIDNAADFGFRHVTSVYVAPVVDVDIPISRHAAGSPEREEA